MASCPTCHRAVVSNARYCSHCGTALQSRPVEGERKIASVLFADVVGSTALAERLDPEDWAGIMNGAFAFMNAAVSHYGGTVSRLMGDAVLAFFGAPIAQEDHAERAVRAALDIQQAAHEYALQIRAQHGVDFGLRVGVSSGTAVLAVLGDEIRAEYTAMGDTANTAARLQALAPAGTVLISADTYRLVHGLFDVRAGGTVEVKGKQSRVGVYEVLSSRRAGATTRGVEGLRSPVVGRAAELTLLEQALAQLRAGSGAVIALVGEAGMGKSRLVAEVRGQAQDAGVVDWYECRAISYGQALAYHPWQQLGRELIGAAENDARATAQEKLRTFAHRLGIPAERLPLLETMLAVESESSRLALGDVDGDALASRVADAVIGTIRALLHAGGETTPHVLVFDDAHWADGASLELLAQLATLAASEPLLLIVLLRPDKQAPSWRLLDRLAGSMGSRFLRIDLQPLGARDAQELLANLLHVEELPDEVRALILQRSDGNPFFLEEVLRSLIDSGHIVADGNRWRATAQISSATIPDTLAGVLAARIDRLPETTKRVAQTAAVIGRIFPYRALTRMLSQAPPPERIDNVEPHLGTLTYEELVRERARQPEREYIFKHALTQESAYGLMLRPRRRALHQLAGSVLEELYADRLEELAPVLAHHFQEGGDARRTAEYAEQAAAHALKLYALEQARDHYDTAYHALSQLSDAPAETVIDAIVAWSVVRYKLKQYDGVVERLTHAETLARESGDQPRLARVLSWIALVYMVMGFPSRGEPYLVESSRLAGELGIEQLLLLPFFFATESMVDQDPRGAVAQFEEVVTLARRLHMPEVEGHALASSALALARLGEFERARQRIDEALAAAGSGGHKVKEADVHIIVGAALYEMGAIDEGLEHARRGAELARQEGAIECACFGYYGVGMGELERRELEQALRSFDRSIDLAQTAAWAGWNGVLPRVRAGAALARLESGSPEALADLESALADARADRDEYAAAALAERLARVRSDGGDDTGALAELNAALEYYQRAGMRLYEARALDLAAQISERAGRREAASEARARAAQLRADTGSTATAAAAPTPAPER